MSKTSIKIELSQEPVEQSEEETFRTLTEDLGMDAVDARFLQALERGEIAGDVGEVDLPPSPDQSSSLATPAVPGATAHRVRRRKAGVSKVRRKAVSE